MPNYGVPAGAAPCREFRRFRLGHVQNRSVVRWHKPGHATTPLSRSSPQRVGSALDWMLKRARILPSGFQKYRFSGGGGGPGHRSCWQPRMRSAPALPISLGVVISMAALGVGGCGSTGAGGSSEAGGSSHAGAESAGHGGNAGTAGGSGTSGTGGSGGRVPTAGASGRGGGASGGASGSGGQGTADMSDPACPATLPATGATCTTVGVCNYSDCAGAGQSIATCDGVKFSVMTSPCQSVPCGTTGSPAHALSCLPNEICVEHQGGNVWYECRPDRCAPGAQACSCSSALCGSNSSCAFQNFKLVCGCSGGCA